MDDEEHRTTDLEQLEGITHDLARIRDVLERLEGRNEVERLACERLTPKWLDADQAAYRLGGRRSRCGRRLDPGHGLEPFVEKRQKK